MKKILLISLALILVSVISYKIGYSTGCAKVIGNWEKMDINDRYMETHCFGDRSMWLDDVERALDKK